MNSLILILACLNLSSCYSQKKEKEQDEYISKDYMKVIIGLLNVNLRNLTLTDPKLLIDP